MCYLLFLVLTICLCVSRVGPIFKSGLISWDSVHVFLNESEIRYVQKEVVGGWIGHDILN